MFIRLGPCRSARLFLLILSLLILASSALARTKTDIVVMKNGDRITCEIRRLEHGQLVIKPPYSTAILAIDWDEVAVIESEQLFQVILTDGERLNGIIQQKALPDPSPSAQSFIVEGEDERNASSHDDVIAIEQLEGNFWKQLDFDIDFGFSVLKADGERQTTLNTSLKRTRVFSELQSHYLFSDRFGRPGKGNDKGKVEGLVGYARRNFMVPAPRFPSWEAFNEQLEAQCLNNRKRRLRRHTETIEERFKRDRQALLPLPPTPYDACDKRTTRVTSLSLVRYRANDYSVPTRYGHRQVLLKGYVDEIVICCGSEEIARHRRSYEREELIFDPLHYLALLERKTNALDQAAPLAGWELPEQFTCLRRLLEARLGKPGKREYVQVLRLLEDFRFEHVAAAVRQACELGAIGLDAVRHLVLCRIEQRPPRLDLTKYPHLPAAQVEQTSAADYLALLAQGGG